jgi:hypothetical protein
MVPVMAKPWGRYELGYLDHQKFLTLNANAIALWWEGKNYCDTHHTDGLIPAEKVKQFRFKGAKSIGLLTTSCGVKTDGVTAYAPLWEVHPVGFKMHDYLDHNDCRDKVLARMDAADERRDADRRRQADWRAREKERRANERRVSHDVTRDANVTVTPSTEAVPETPVEAERERERVHTPPFDVWFFELVRRYPQQRRQSGPAVQQAFLQTFNGRTDPAEHFAAMVEALDNHLASDEWARGFVPKLENWLTRGLWAATLPSASDRSQEQVSAKVPAWAR